MCFLLRFTSFGSWRLTGSADVQMFFWCVSCSCWGTSILSYPEIRFPLSGLPTSNTQFLNLVLDRLLGAVPFCVFVMQSVNIYHWKVTKCYRELQSSLPSLLKVSKKCFTILLRATFMQTDERLQKWWVFFVQWDYFFMSFASLVL